MHLRAAPPADVVITMGCNVQCPHLPCLYREDWGLEDPSGKEDAAFLETMAQIESRMLDLRQRIETGALFFPESTAVPGNPAPGAFRNLRFIDAEQKT